jgi:hypothetical protein
MNWLLLDQAPSFDEVSKAYRKYCLEDAQEIDLLLDEVVQIEEIYPKFPAFFSRFSRVHANLVEKWKICACKFG